jgi:hypothetical protein
MDKANGNHPSTLCASPLLTQEGSFACVLQDFVNDKGSPPESGGETRKAWRGGSN